MTGKTGRDKNMLISIPTGMNTLKSIGGCLERAAKRVEKVDPNRAERIRIVGTKLIAELLEFRAAMDRLGASMKGAAGATRDLDRAWKKGLKKGPKNVADAAVKNQVQATGEDPQA
jgi:hypothetical protein